VTEKWCGRFHSGMKETVMNCDWSEIKLTCTVHDLSEQSEM